MDVRYKCNWRVKNASSEDQSWQLDPFSRLRRKFGVQLRLIRTRSFGLIFPRFKYIE